MRTRNLAGVAGGVAVVLAMLSTVTKPLGGAPPQPPESELLVFAAASLTDAFEEMGRVLARRPFPLHITFSFAASSTLRTQILQGARADVFASADARNRELVGQGGRLGSEPVVFARNEPVVVTPRAGSRGIARLQDLALPGVKIVLASPEVPIGAYARQILTRLSHDPAFSPDFADRVMRNVVSEEPDVRASLARVALGEADATFVYRSDVSSQYGARVRLLEIPRESNIIASYYLALVRDAPHPRSARMFVGFVMSHEGRRILERWGFLPP